jgi:hypothetical protein
MEGKLAKSARVFQRKGLKNRETVAAAARKAGVSAKVFKGALKNPSKTLRKHQEATKIKAEEPQGECCRNPPQNLCKIAHRPRGSAYSGPGKGQNYCRKAIPEAK